MEIFARLAVRTMEGARHERHERLRDLSQSTPCLAARPPAPAAPGTRRGRLLRLPPGIDSQEDKNAQWAARSRHNIVQYRNLHDQPQRHQGRIVAGQDVDHRDGNSVKQDADVSLPVERNDDGERLIDQDTGFFVVSPVIGE